MCAADAGLTAALDDGLWARRGCFQRFGRVLTVGNSLLYSSNIGWGGLRCGGRGDKRAVPERIASQVQVLAVCQANGDCAIRACFNLFTGNDFVSFHQ